MAIEVTLDGIELPGLIIENRYGVGNKIEAVINYSLGGTPIIYEQAVSSYKINLIGTDSIGYLSKTKMAALKAIASVINTTYTLIYWSQSYLVRFRHSEIPVITGTPITNSEVSFEVNSYYNNVLIKLMVL